MWLMAVMVLLVCFWKQIAMISLAAVAHTHQTVSRDSDDNTVCGTYIGTVCVECVEAAMWLTLLAVRQYCCGLIKWD